MSGSKERILRYFSQECLILSLKPVEIQASMRSIQGIDVIYTTEYRVVGVIY